MASLAATAFQPSTWSSSPKASKGSTPFDDVLKVQLEALHQTLREQHVNETEQLRNSVVLLQRQIQLLSGEGDVESKESKPSVDGQDAGSAEKGVDDSTPVEKWADFVSKLLMRDALFDPDDELCRPMLLGQDLLKMHPSWNIAFQEASRIASRGQNFRTTIMTAASTLRMNDALRDEDSHLQRLVVGPRSMFQLFWSIIGSIFIIWDLVTIPLEMFDVPKFIEFLSEVGKVSLTYWALDMPTNLIFGREIKGKLEMRPSVLLRLYLKSWFALDVVVIFIDVMLLVLEGILSAGFRSARFLRTLRLLRLLRLVRVAKLQQALSLVANRLLSAHAFMVMKVVAGLVMILAINHLIACCWYGIGTVELDGKSWIVQAEIGSEFTEAYAASIHWALTQFTPATNNIAPDNALERFFSVWVILLAMGVFSSFISSITSTVSSLRTAREEQFKQQSKLLRFFNERNLSIDLYGQVQESIRKQGVFEVRLKEADVNLIQNIPERLKMQLHDEMFASPLYCLGMWPTWSQTRDQPFFRNLCHQGMTENVATPTQDAFMSATSCTCAYVLQSGSMRYLAKQKTNSQIMDMIRQKIDPSAVLCLPSLWADWQHRGRLTAEYGTCYYIKIDAEKFCSIATQYGGPLWQYLQIFGILLIGAVDNRDELGMWVSDLGFEENELDRIVMRAQRIAAIMNAHADGEILVASSASEHLFLSEGRKPSNLKSVEL
ncbi:KCNH2 [Symbiodinium natans]|uniref:KCNH2 protein n=1 Tax=Symbiodinium natans TaxID=878477 RepID=A0A812UNY5_9DINO|nr:KCNH2 [Symbiodinium natans]